MEHYSIMRWCDYARGLVAEAERSAMSAHLEGGCWDCSQIAKTFADVAALAQNEERYRVPLGNVQSAKELFELQKDGIVAVRRQLFCRPKQTEAEVNFLVNVFADGIRDITRCSIFGDGPVTCDKKCLAVLR